MYKDMLPIGSVVLLKGGDKRVMICGRIQAKAGENVIYDYSACYYPEGIVDPSAMFFFNRDAIDTVYFVKKGRKRQITWCLQIAVESVIIGSIRQQKEGYSYALYNYFSWKESII